MNKFKYLAFAGIVVAFAGCAVNMHTVYDQHVAFDKYKTYCWMEGCELKTSASNAKDTTLQERLKRSIAIALKEKGLTLDTSNPDLLVGFTITLKDEQVIAYQQSENMPFYRPLPNDSKVVNYLKGTLVLGMADKKESKMVWESFAVRYFEEKPAFSEQDVLEGIKLVLKKFPPK